MGKIIRWLILVFGEQLPLASKFISVRSKTLAKEEFILDARLDIKGECAMSAIEMLPMENYMLKVGLIHVKYVLESEFNLYRLLLF
jgi:hypothetical protein